MVFDVRAHMLKHGCMNTVEDNELRREGLGLGLWGEEREKERQKKWNTMLFVSVF